MGSFWHGLCRCLWEKVNALRGELVPLCYWSILWLKVVDSCVWYEMKWKRQKQNKKWNENICWSDSQRFESKPFTLKTTYIKIWKIQLQMFVIFSQSISLVRSGWNFSVELRVVRIVDCLVLQTDIWLCVSHKYSNIPKAKIKRNEQQCEYSVARSYQI